MHGTRADGVHVHGTILKGVTFSATKSNATERTVTKFDSINLNETHH
jgi:hypothetical protein